MPITETSPDAAGNSTAYVVMEQRSATHQLDKQGPDHLLAAKVKAIEDLQQL